MSKIQIKESVYSVHPVFNLYASNENGDIIHIIKNIPTKGNKKKNGYLSITVRKQGGSKKTMYSHRFVWECFNGLIPDGQVIDHINNVKTDNRLCNLQMFTHQQNCKKAAKKRDYSFVSKNRENRKCVKATNLKTKNVSYFTSMYAAQEFLGINAGIIKMVCEGLNNCKSGKSKKDGCYYVFQFIKPDELPFDCLKKNNKKYNFLDHKMD